MVISLYHRVYQLKTPHNHKLHIKIVIVTATPFCHKSDMLNCQCLI